MSFEAELVLSQLTHSNRPMNRLSVMIGATNFSKNEKERSVSFRFKMCKDYNYVTIKQNGKDLYDVTFTKYIWSKMKQTRTITHNDVYCEDLFNLFQNTTKLYLSLKS